MPCAEQEKHAKACHHSLSCVEVHVSSLPVNTVEYELYITEGEGQQEEEQHQCGSCR